MTTGLGALVVGFLIGYAATRPADPCPVCGQPATASLLCALCAPVVHPRKEIP